MKEKSNKKIFLRMKRNSSFRFVVGWVNSLNTLHHIETAV